MEPFSVRTTLTLIDWQAYQKAFGQRLQQHGRSRSSVLGMVVAAVTAVAVFCIFLLLDAFHHKLDLPSAFLGIAFVIAVIVVARQRTMKLARPEEGGAFLGPCSYDFDPEGIRTAQNGLNSNSQWSRVRAITVTADHVFIWIDRLAAHVVPLRNLPEGLTSADAITRLQTWAAAANTQIDLAHAAPATFSDSSPQPGRSEAEPAESGRQGPRRVFRLLTLRGTDATVPSGSTLSIALLCLFSLALWAGLDWLRNVPEPQFYPYTAPELAWFILAALLTAAAMARLSHPAIALPRVFALLAIVIPILLAVDFAIEMYVPERWAALALAVPCLYVLAYCSRGLKTLSGTRQPVALAGGALVAIAFLWIGSAAYVHPALWVERGVLDDTQEENDWDAAEDVLFEQSARIDASVANVVRPPGEAPVAFFVGFAGYGGQRVFAEEIKLAAQVFGQRFDTASRTILLLNDKRDLDAQPLASVSGLRYALKGLASRMQLDRDVLFLALSSHGSEEPFLSVSNGSIPLNDLSGAGLAEALRESGIQWRVIVISACHAGAFIKDLKDPHTIVLTAAASDRTSFGCSDERDLTYFGETFFRDSLPKAASLREAFNAAKALIAQREKQEGIEASKPQAFFGEAMERRLAEMEHPAG